jgi:hypothetical protein
MLPCICYAQQMKSAKSLQLNRSEQCHHVQVKLGTPNTVQHQHQKQQQRQQCQQQRQPDDLDSLLNELREDSLLSQQTHSCKASAQQPELSGLQVSKHVPCCTAATAVLS